MLLTIVGAAAIVLGVMLPFAGQVVTAAGLDDGALEQALGERGLKRRASLVDLPGLLSVGLVLLVAGGSDGLRFTGTSGRLTRWTALLAVAVLVVAGVVFSPFGLGAGVITIGLGCVLGYVGGLLGRR